MRLIIDHGTTVMLHFKHRPVSTVARMTHQTTVALHFGDCPKPEQRAATGICPALVDEAEAEIWHGAAHCSVRDEFVKATGRKIALTRALTEMDPATRTKIWNAYWVELGLGQRVDVAAYPVKGA